MKRKLWPWVLALLAAVGVPAGVIALVQEQALQNPWLTLGLLVLYEAVVLVLSFATQVWEKLLERWVEPAADWVEQTLLEAFSRCRRRYVQHLIYRHRDFDVKGLTTQGVYTLQLEHVFVELSIAPQPAHRVRLYALLVASTLYRYHRYRSRSWASRLGIGRDAELSAELLRLADVYLNLYVDLRILHERIEGSLPAVEGIRIVRERRGAGGG